MPCGYSPYNSTIEEKYALDILIVNHIEFIKHDGLHNHNATAFLCKTLYEMTLEDIKNLNSVPGDWNDFHPLDWYKEHLRRDFLARLDYLPLGDIALFIKKISEELIIKGHGIFYNECERIFNLQELHRNEQDAKPERSSDS